MPPKLAKRDEGLLVRPKAAPSFCRQRTKPLEVMIVGLSRTGTSSMLEAMSTLGYGTIYNSREMVKRDQIRFASEAFLAKHEGKSRLWRKEQFESLWGEYTAISGEMASSFGEELIPMYPEAKVILTVRDDEERWMQSLRDSIWWGNQGLATKLLRLVDGQWADMGCFMNPFWKYVFHDDVPNHGIRVYREHNAMVKRVTEPERLLVYNTAEGWEPLCEFLGKPVPEQPFPHVNKVEEHRNPFSSGRRAALIAWFWWILLRRTLPVVLLLLILLQKRRLIRLLRHARTLLT